MLDKRDMARYELSDSKNSRLLIGNYIVYKAIDLNTSKNVIIKTSIDDKGKLLQKEQKIVQQIKTKSIVSENTIIKYKSQKEKQIACVIQSNFDNTLSYYIHNNKLNYLDKIYIAKQLVKSIKCLHGIQVTLGDLNPFNVLIRNETKKLTPLLINIYNPPINNTKGVKIATDFYKSPEHITSGKATIKSDIYSLGMILHELFNNERPFTITSKNDLPSATNQRIFVCNKVKSELDITPKVIKKIIRTCTNVEPNNRNISLEKIYKSLKKAQSLKCYSETKVKELEDLNFSPFE